MIAVSLRARARRGGRKAAGAEAAAHLHNALAGFLAVALVLLAPPS